MVNSNLRKMVSMLLIMVILVANLPQVSLAQVSGHPDTKAQLMAALVEQYGEDTAAELFELEW